MNTIISAKSANEAVKKMIEKDNSDLDAIMDAIQKAIARKEFYCHYSGVMKDYTLEKLKKLGYKTEYFNGGNSQREPSYYKISWE